MALFCNLSAFPIGGKPEIVRTQLHTILWAIMESEAGTEQSRH